MLNLLSLTTSGFDQLKILFQSSREIYLILLYRKPILTSVHFNLTGISLQMTIGFGALKIPIHCVLVYICAKYRTCSLIVQICVYKYNVLTSIHNKLTGMP